jgi:hypothetical protein
MMSKEVKLWVLSYPLLWGGGWHKPLFDCFTLPALAVTWKKEAGDTNPIWFTTSLIYFNLTPRKSCQHWLTVVNPITLCE